MPPAHGHTDRYPATLRLSPPLRGRAIFQCVEVAGWNQHRQGAVVASDLDARALLRTPAKYVREVLPDIRDRHALDHDVSLRMQRRQSTAGLSPSHWTRRARPSASGRS